MIPDTLDGYAVAGIADGTVDTGVFYNKAITSVKLPYGLEYIGAYAFNTNQLDSVDIPNNVTYIGSEAFSKNLLTDFQLPAPQKEGYTFDGWNDNIPADTWVTDLSIAYTANFTLETDTKDFAGFTTKLYPNPTNGLITIESDYISSVEIISVSGLILQKLHVTGSRFTIDVSSLENGIYIVKITGEYDTCIKRIIKE